jgi:cytochrome c2
LKDEVLNPSVKVYWFQALSALVLLALLAGCAGEQDQAASLIEGGDPARGELAIQRHGCHSCHRIPGIPGANSYIGPPLNGWSDREYIAGALQNTPDNLIAWIMEPQAIQPGTAMPDMGIHEAEARDIAAYLYTLEAEGQGLWSRGE